MNWTLEDIFKLVHFHQVRAKLFQFAEIYRLTKIVPSQIISQSKSIVDPFYYLTQSGKGYNPLLARSIQLYSQPELTGVTKSGLGLDTGIYSFNYKVYQPPEESFYFWNLYKATPFLANILKLPGVVDVYIFGSCLQGCATQTSDVDLAIHVENNTALSTRILVKSYLKIINMDVYSIRFGLITSIIKLVQKAKLISLEKSRSWLNQQENNIWKFRHRKAVKIDAGVFFSDIKQHQDTFFDPIRHYFMYDVRRFSFYKKGKNFIPSLQPIPEFAGRIAPKFLTKIIQKILWLPSKIYLRNKIRNNTNPNHILTSDFICFVPIGPEPRFLVRV